MFEELNIWQDEASRLIRVRKKTCLWDPTGMGKCKMFIQAVDHLEDQVLIVCKRTMIRTWANQIRKWSRHPVRGVLEIKAPSDVALALTHKWLIVSYDSIRFHSKQKVKDKVTGDRFDNPKYGKPATSCGERLFLHFVNYGWPTALALDEHHRLANDHAGYFLAAKALSMNTEFVVPISATPYMNGIADVWTGLFLVNSYKWKSKWKFLKEWANARPGAFGWVWDKCTDKPEAFAEHIKNYVIMRPKLRGGWDKLPPEHIYLEPSAIQAKMIYKMEKEVLAEMPSGEFFLLPNPLVKLTRIRQVTACPKIIDPAGGLGVKIETLAEDVQEHALAGKKVIVLSCFAQVLSEAYHYLNKMGMPGALITGEVAPEQRDVFIEKFNNSSVQDMPVAYLTIGDIAEGITLTAASVIIYLDRHFNPARNLQAEDRVDRPGQTKDIEIFNYLLDGSSSDELTEEIISGKEFAASEIYEHIRSRHDRL